MIGEVLGNRYEIEEKIGEGGMSIVYKARCNKLNRYVAVKVLKKEMSDNEDIVNKFKREATAIAALSDNNIVNILDVGSQDDVNYIVMEYVKGKTLKELIKQFGKLNYETAITIAIQIAKALECAHKNNIIHRDVKPQNILVTEEGLIKVTDFGIAKSTSSATLTNTTTIMGSAHYFSPEQAKGTLVDNRTDLYSLGVVLYEMVTGKVPFEADSPVTIALKHIQEEVVPPKQINSKIPESLNKLIIKAMEKDPGMRYQNARDIINDLQKIKEDPNAVINNVVENEENEHTIIMGSVNAPDNTKAVNKALEDEYYEDDEDDEDTDDEDDNTVSDSENIAVDSNISNNNAQQGNLNSGNNSLYKRVTYKVNNEILTESSIGYNAARAAINKVSYYEVENDVDHYITLGLSQTNIMQNVRIFINGSQINYDVVNQDKSNNTMEIRFKVPALSTELTVKTYITAMGTDTSFGIKFLESTLELVNTEESESQISGGSVAGTLSGDASNGNSSSILGSTLGFKTGTNNAENENYEDILVDESELEAKEYFKRYTVNNEVVSDSAMGRTMARKYLNETSIVEEIDGKLYATVTFSGSNSMENFKFEVNGQEVSHSVILNDTENELISLRFPINDINDEIKAYIYIKPMRMTISFGIKLLEDTLLLVEEGTIEKDEDIVEGVTNLSEKLSSLNNNNSNNQVNVWKIAIITAVLSTIMNFSVGGVIYLIIK